MIKPNCLNQVVMYLTALTMFAGPANAAQVFPPENESECTTGTHLSWKGGSQNVRCEPNAALLPVCGDGQYVSSNGNELTCADLVPAQLAPCMWRGAVKPILPGKQTAVNSHGGPDNFAPNPAPSGSVISGHYNPAISTEFSASTDGVWMCLNGNWILTGYRPSDAAQSPSD